MNAAQFSNKRILVVEDSLTQAEQLHYILEENGFKVTVANNGQEGLETLRSQTPDIVISDILMPVMDGYELCEAIKSDEAFKDIPVILLTSLSSAHDVMKSLQCGADNFIRKPYNDNYLLSRIQNILATRELRKARKIQMGAEIYRGGQRYFITAERQQMVDLLISIYEEAMHMNEELQIRQKELAHFNQSLNGLYHVAVDLNAARTEAEVGNKVLQRVLELPGVQAGWIEVKNGDADFRMLASCSLPASIEKCISDMGDCQCRRRLLSGEFSHAANIRRCERLKKAATQTVLPPSHAGIPLRLGERTLGIMNLIGEEEFSDEALKTLLGVGHQIAIALERARLHQHLETLVQQRTTDLTQEIAVRMQAEETIRQNEAMLRKILDTLPVGVWVADKQGHIVLGNPAGQTIWGGAFYAGLEQYDRYQGRYSDTGERVTPEKCALARALKHGDISLNEMIDIECDGTRKTILNSVVPLFSPTQQITGAIVVNEDITERRKAEEILLLRNRAIEASVNSIIITNCAKEDNPIEYVNPAFERITGYSRDEVIGRNCRFLQGQDNDQPGIESIRAAVREQREGHAIIRNYHKDGSLFWNELFVAPVRDKAGKVTHFIGVQNDITEAKRNQEQLEYQAQHDALTGLASRLLFADHASQGIAHANRFDRQMAIMLLDLDRFKLINDSFGHASGDALLQTIAARLVRCVKKIDTVSRFGGDEFALIITEIDNADDVLHVATRILDEIAKPMMYQEHELYVTASIGISLYPKDGDDGESLLKNADIAMYRAKAVGRNGFQFYAQEMHERAMEYVKLETRLRHALQREEFLVHYQPKLNLATGKLAGAEALIRWQRPESGLVSPTLFVPLAEETGLIVPIGTWTLEIVCAQIKIWQSIGLSPVRIAINFSARQFRQKNLVLLIASILQKTGIEPQYLEVEVTESMLMGNPDEAITTMRELHNLGLKLSLDDFGTGYSCLSCLQHFPIDKLKIDQSFVRDITANPEKAAITTSIIHLAHALKLKVIAEGVENQDQLDFLRHEQCDEIQGNYFSHPLPADAFGKLLASHAMPHETH